MDRSWWTRVFIIGAIAVGVAWLLVPTYYSFFVLEKKDRNDLKVLAERLPNWAPPASYRISLGLDLQGGIHMVMRVDTKTALIKRTERRAQFLGQWVKDKKLGEVTVAANPEQYEFTLTAADPATMDSIEKEVLSNDDLNKVRREGPALTLSLKQSYVDYFMGDAVNQAMLVIRRRIDKWGVAEVDLRKVGTDSIQISLPGKQDPEQAKELIGTTAQLEFRILAEESGTFFRDVFQKTPPDAASGITLNSSTEEGFPQLEAKDREPLLAYLKDKVPTGKMVLLHCIDSESKKHACDKYQSYLLEQNAYVTGENLTDASAQTNMQDNSSQVNFSFNAQGAKEFGDLTTKNTKRKMAIVLDDNVTSAPVINEPITQGSGRITIGRRGRIEERLKDAQNLALVLKAGALPAPVAVGEIRQVGAALGDELIKKGSLAAVVGLLLVVVFMAVYYRLSGLVADVALILNGALILGGLVMVSGTLTLPGIAGFVLTLGIAVDANVLINERIREELAEGKSARAAVDQGYDRAFWTIFDAHVTTLIAGVILAFTGTGPVQGFATTLIIGIVASLFTSIVVTRTITTYIVHGRNAQSVSV